VVMEATGDYWKGPFYRLEAEGFECVLADAKQVKHLPGRPKRDPSDSRWLAACFERGAVTACFVATEEFRVIRLHTRYRRDLTGERTREKQRAEKLLESAAVKLSSVVTDLHGVTGRDIMDHLIAGERSPKVLAQLARARARAPPQDRRAGRGAGGRGVLHPGARRLAQCHAGPHRPGQRRDRPADRGNRAAAGPV
jgi:transposase